MLQTSDLQFSYDSHTNLRFPDISCQKGESWLLLGQSGSGKTTLLHLLGGLLSPHSGKIIVADSDITQLSSRALDRYRGRNIGIIFQQSHFVGALNVEDNLALAQKLAGLRIDRARIARLLEQLGVGHKLKARPDRLSVGEQQRVAIARALVNRPSIILADEPTSALDDVNCEEVINLIAREARAVDATLLVVTHDNRLKERFPKQIVLTHQNGRPA
jgi:ABC-type lipoprotein export system ATPase subunit